MLVMPMTKINHTKKNIGISPERPAELRRPTRLAGSKLSNKQVEQVVNTVSGQK